MHRTTRRTRRLLSALTLILGISSAGLLAPGHTAGAAGPITLTGIVHMVHHDAAPTSAPVEGPGVPVHTHAVGDAPDTYTEVLDTGVHVYELAASDLPPGIEPGATVRVTTLQPTLLADGTPAPLPVLGMALVTPAPPTPQGPQKVLFIPVTWAGATMSGSPADLAATAATLDAWYRDVSEGATSIAATVTPWLTISDPGGCSTTGQWYGMQSAAEGAARIAGYNPDTYSHIVLYLAESADAGARCGFAGLGEVGGRRVWIAPRYFDVRTTSHELGHNLGLWHANAYRCSAASVAITLPALAQEASECYVGEYEDPFSTMGSLYWRNSGHFNGIELDTLGWLGNGEKVTATRGTYHLAPIGSSGGLKTIAVPTSWGGTYWIEYRRPVGVDTVLSTFPAGMGVQVRYQPPSDPAIPGPLLLDVRPGSLSSWRDFTDAALGTGQPGAPTTWTDPSGELVLRVTGTGSDYADVQVNGPAVAPTAPRNVKAKVGDGWADVSFTAPADDGGGGPIRYDVVAAPVAGSSAKTIAAATTAASPRVSGSTSPIRVSGLTTGATYSFTVTAANSAGSSAAAATAAPVLIASPAGTFSAGKPYRLLDTRSGFGALRSYSTLSVPVLGRGGIPSHGVGAVTINLTTVSPSGSGYLTAYPCGATVPGSSTLNFDAGDVRAAGATVKLGDGGAVCVYAFVGDNPDGTLGTSDVIVDVTGWFADPSGDTGGRLTPIRPKRLVDTRTTDRVPAGGVLTVDVGHAMPGATGAVINLTAVNPDADGYLTAYPCGSTPPLASNLNYTAGSITANAATVALSNAGTVCVVSQSATDVIVDLTGAYGQIAGEGSSFTGITPKRVLDTRTSGGPVTSGSISVGKLSPTASSAVALTATVTNPGADGYLTLFPCGGSLPPSSNVNFEAGQTVANAVVVGATDGRVCFVANTPTDVILDVTGLYA